jgi:adenylate cyclase class 2
MKHVEVEIKHSLPDPALLKARLEALGAKLVGESRQVDTYFNAPHKDFLSGDVVSEWLRLRRENKGAGAGDKVSINFKRWHPVGAAISTHCDEFESTVTDGQAVRHLLEGLDFSEMITVDKTRRELRLDDVAVAIDTVIGLGSFVEFEYVGDAQTVDEATAALNDAIRRIGVPLGARDRRGYPYLLLKRER